MLRIKNVTFWIEIAKWLLALQVTFLELGPIPPTGV